MTDFAGRTAFITGGANGIGLGIARSLARAGANVAIADIEESALASAQAGIEGLGGHAIALAVDVSQSNELEAAAAAVESAFGNVHYVFANAGVSLGSVDVTAVEAEQWRWLFDVNVFGVLNTDRAFLPRMTAHGEGGHIVNTASIGGLQVHPTLRNGSYSMTKYAVVALSEALELQLAGTAINVSVLCPAAVRTTLGESSKRRPTHLGGPFDATLPSESRAAQQQPEVLDPEDVGERVLQAMADGEFFIFTHSDPRAWIDRRAARITAAFDSVDGYNVARAAGAADRPSTRPDGEHCR
jgi:NAD(P)-dependent dehydrogenase (short-subunit alcohol dehydrogenase family)